MNTPRRVLLQTPLLLMPGLAQGAAEFQWAPVDRTPLQFPQDHGAHPDHRTEWWYVTAWMSRAGSTPFGLQLTFFRSRSAHPAANPSRFAPTQLIFLHAALALPEKKKLLHVEQAGRAGSGLADVAVGDTRVWTRSGAQQARLVREAETDRYQAMVDAPAFGYTLELDPAAPPLLQGEAAYSRKGPGEKQASRYYSRPQMRIAGQLRIGRENAVAVQGLGWFDHEWSSETLDAASVGWDWTGLNFDDGSVLMAFRMRGADGSVRWTEAGFRQGPNGPLRSGLQPVFTPLRTWTSPRTGGRWPVSMRLEVAGRTLQLDALFDDQELDARATTGVPYWEGAVTATENGRPVARGYLELTGYAGAIRM